MSGENEEYKNKAREQSRMEGQQKQVKVKSYPDGTALAHLLLDLDFPANIEKIIQHIVQKSRGNTR